MREYDIPDEEERLCIECSRKENVEDFEEARTLQIPVSIEVIQGNRSCFGRAPSAKWKWECLECHEVQY